jgi:arylsulfatase
MRREARFAKQKQLGLFPPDAKLSPCDPVAASWHSLSEAERDEWDLRMATYVPMIEVMHTGLDRMFSATKEFDLEMNTVVMFLSDNGSSAEILDQWPVHGPYSHTPGAECGTPESRHCLEVGCSNAANTPYREHKMCLHQGGIATPFIVAGGMVTEGKGRHGDTEKAWRREVGHLIDLMPTCLALAGASHPADFGGAKTHPLPGRAIAWSPSLPICACPHPLAWEHDGQPRHPHRRLEALLHLPAALGTLRSLHRSHRAARPRQSAARPCVDHDHPMANLGR